MSYLMYEDDPHLKSLEERIRELETEIKYWEARASTAEEKVKDWSVRSVEQEERIAKARKILKVAYRYDTIALLKTLEQTLEGALEGK